MGSGDLNLRADPLRPKLLRIEAAQRPENSEVSEKLLLTMGIKGSSRGAWKRSSVPPEIHTERRCYPRKSKSIRSLNRSKVSCRTQVPTQGGIEYRNPSAGQTFEVDFVDVAQP